MTDTLTASRTLAATAPHQTRVGLALLALALGGFALGTTEFVTMGLLPEVATGTATDIPTAGHYVSAYAVGVVVGAPLIALLAARLPRKTVLIALMAWFGANRCDVVSMHYSFSFDEDPPLARLDQNFDPFTASPLGFTAKVAVSQAF